MSTWRAEGKHEKEGLTYNLQDFCVTTSNKQLSFVQHIKSMLKTTGKEAVVLPDNVLFEGGAGETVKKIIGNRRIAYYTSPAHRHLLRQRRKGQRVILGWRPASKDPWTKEVWVYDYRTNIHHTLKKIH